MPFGQRRLTSMRSAVSSSCRVVMTSTMDGSLMVNSSSPIALRACNRLRFHRNRGNRRQES